MRYDEIERRGTRDISQTIVNHDGTKNRFALEVTNVISRKLHIPITASGVDGTAAHFTVLFKETQASAGLAASIFHFGELPVPELKKQLLEARINVRTV